MKDNQFFDHIKIQLASPERVRAWSYGEVKKPETINYRTFRPERDGLFCERIFGTTKEWECYCGKFKSIRYRGVVCDRCGVEVTHFKVRRERMGHIELAAPVSHIWYYRSVPSRMGLLLDMTIPALRSVLYYEKHIVIDAGTTELKQLDLLSEEEYLDAVERFGINSFTADMGAEAIRVLLKNLDLKQILTTLREKMVEKRGKDKQLLNRIAIIEDFIHSGNRPEWMILETIPVIPPDLRPMVQLEGGRFATSDLNDLYRRVINRNNRLDRLIKLNAPDIIVRNEKRMLQEAVDSLFDNSKRKRVVKGSSNRPLKSLSDLLKGKQGRFRQNLLGKRVDYSGRSVIVVGPELKMHQCGLPSRMALELFKPFIMQRLVNKEVVMNIKKAKALVEQDTPEVWSVLDEVVKEHPVLLNRAPTLHRLGFQAFEPVLVEGKAIRLHPLVCNAYNADFDGDQMAVHVPLTPAAQIECWSLMLSVNNLLNPANGEPVVFPSQDIVLGINYLTLQIDGAKGEGKVFADSRAAILARECGFIDYNAVCKIKIADQYLETTPGRAIFNAILPEGMDYVNYALDDKALRELVGKSFAMFGPSATVKMLDAVKNLGFTYATKFGATISMVDVVIPPAKKTMIDNANNDVINIQQQYSQGHITQEERYNRVVDVWHKTNESLTNEVMKTLREDRGGLNPIFLMAQSGARGSRTQIRQLAGMRGLMAKPSGDIIELPIRSNFKEGLSVIEFFISTNGARKGLADTALKTADAGYLTRRLVDIAQDVVINERDCGTISGTDAEAIKDGEEIVEPLRDRIKGRFTIEQVKHPITGEMIIDVNQEITDRIAEEIESVGIEKVRIRTVFTCESRFGVCQYCYGRNLASNKTVEIGEAVGIIAAQSIGQPGTQLTMRTFHIGGAATKVAEENRIHLSYPVIVTSITGNNVTLDNGIKLFTRKGFISVARVLQRVAVTEIKKMLVEDGQKVALNLPICRDADDHEVLAEFAGFVRMQEEQMLVIAQEQKIDIRNGAELIVDVGQIVEAEDSIANFDPFSEPIIAEHDAVVRFEDIIPGATLREELNEDINKVEKIITEQTLETLQPRIFLVDDQDNELGVYYLPGGAYLSVEDGERVSTGRTLAKLAKESVKTGDITGGLPRVGELFEARRPKSATVLAMVDGRVEFRSIVKGKRVIAVVDQFGKEYIHYVPMGKHLFVHDNDLVEAGESLCDGPVDPHDILNISGENALQSFLINEVQEVYRLQGVEINDKHIGVIIRQMMRKIEIQDVGDTNFIYGQQVTRYQFFEANRQVMLEGGKPAIGRPLLQGITKSSLNIESFLSAASFQETTKVLTNAAIKGSVDYLRGLKENVVIGHPIPAGTGMRRYKNVKIYQDDQDVDQLVEQKKEERRLARLKAEEEARRLLEEDMQADNGEELDDSDNEIDRWVSDEDSGDEE